MGNLLDDKVNILWLSDIHFNSGYISDQKIKNYLEVFIDEIKSFHEKSPIQYILISGDIANFGLEKEYQLFDEHLLKPIYDKLDSPNVITIPGNHDVEWSGLKLIKAKFKSQGTSKDSFFNNRNAHINNDLNLFKKPFNQYSKLFVGQSKYETSNNYVELSQNYKENRLFGYAIDKTNRIIFILINSAWFSFGNKNIKDILKGNHNQPIYRRTTKRIDRRMDWFYDTSLKMNEFGNLIVGKKLLKDEKILDLLDDENFSDYMVISTMHHPTHWLNWRELYQYDHSNPEDLVLFEILKKTDVLLTGHEHLPKHIEATKINNSDTIHLQAGMFLENNKFEHNRFSIVQVDNVNDKIIEKRFFYHKEESRWIHKEIKSNKGESKEVDVFVHNLSEIKVEKRKNSKIIVPNVKKEHLINFNLIEYLNEYRLDLNSANLSAITHSTPNDDYTITKIDVDGEKRFLLLPLKSDFYKNHLCNFNNNPHLVDNIYRNMIDDFKLEDQRTLIISIICLDIFVESNIYDKHNGQRSSAYGKIVEQADMYFDNFRNKIFRRYENEEILYQIPFEIIKNIRFTNEIIPFWCLYKYQKKA